MALPLPWEEHSAGDSPEHEVHELEPLPLEEAVPIGRQHEAGAEAVEQVLHHLLLLRRGRVVALEHLGGKPRVNTGGLLRHSKGSYTTVTQTGFHPAQPFIIMGCISS